MKSKTIFYLCLLMILLGGLVMDILNRFIGIVILGVFSYIAGAYQIKSRLEEANEP